MLHLQHCHNMKVFFLEYILKKPQQQPLVMGGWTSVHGFKVLSQICDNVWVIIHRQRAPL